MRAGGKDGYKRRLSAIAVTVLRIRAPRVGSRSARMRLQRFAHAAENACVELTVLPSCAAGIP